MRETGKKKRTGGLAELVVCAALAFAVFSCRNALTKGVKELQTEAVSPRLSLNVASTSSTTAVGANGELAFPNTSPGGIYDLELTIANSGKSSLAIDLDNISITSTNGTEDGSFDFVTNPQASIAAGKSSTFILRFSPTSIGAKSATISIPSNDAITPLFSFTVNGSGVSDAKAITSFGFKSPAATGVISGTSISVSLPFGTGVTGLVATFTTTGSSVTVEGNLQISGTTANDFSKSVSYLVTAADGSTRTYSVTVKVATNTDKEISSFSFASLGIVAAISGSTISATLPNGTDVTGLVATFSTTGTSVKVGSAVQVSGTTANNFASSLIYTVYASDGSTRDYTVTITVAKSSAKEITSFSFVSPSVSGSIDKNSRTIALILPVGSTKTSLVASFATTGASVKVNGVVQQSGTTANDFSNSVAYVVAAEDGSTQSYTVTVTVTTSSSKALTAFYFASLADTATGIGYGTILGTTIAVSVPSGTILSALVATFSTTGSKVSVGSSIQASGVTANDFSSPLTYLVTASDGSEASYVVTVTAVAVVPKVSTSISDTDIGSTSVKVSGNVTSAGGVSVQGRGVCYGTSAHPTIANSYKASSTTGTGSYTVAISGLSLGTLYYVRAYATNSAGTGYGDEVSFVTLDLPSVSTLSSVAITGATTAGSGGSVSSDGGATVTAYGVCWSTSSAPTISDSHTTDGAGTGSFTSVLSGLGSGGVAYYLRAYATNEVGTAYGSQVSFSTPTLAAVSTSAISGLGSTGATCGGTVSSEGGVSVTARGLCWGASSLPTLDSCAGYTSDGSGSGSFSSSITGLSSGATYYARAYATNAVGTAYGSSVSFTTLSLPTVSLTSVSAVSATAATAACSVSSNGGATISAYGICWSASSASPSLSSSDGIATTSGAVSGGYASNMTGLTAGSSYYVRAYATNSVGIAYSSYITYAAPTAPTIATSSISVTGATTATAYGSISANGGSTITAYGFCWSSSSSSPTTVSNTGIYTVSGTTSGSYSGGLTSLVALTTYYVRAYASNVAGTSYGSAVSFTMPTLPTVSVSGASATSASTATASCAFSSNGGSTVTAYGLCWSNSSTTPTLASCTGYAQTSGAPASSYTSSITGLSAGTTYYLRAYATNAAGTGYSSYYTYAAPTIPSVTTSSASATASTTASAVGSVSSNGGSTVTSYGFCWTTSGTPSISSYTGIITNAGSASGSFSGSLTGLTTGTTYYLRAYATNVVGTAYGSTLSFTTWATPTLSLSSVSAASASTATASCSLSANGGSTITAYGVCWSTVSSAPTISSNQGIASNSGSVSGGYSCSMTGLTVGYTYFVRAYATNSVGTAYSSTYTYAAPTVPVVATSAAAANGSTTASASGNISSSGGSALTAYGFCWSSSSSSPTISANTGISTVGVSTSGSFSGSLTGLTIGTTYYLRAYATNIVGTAYGSAISFTTWTLPTLTVGSASIESGTSAQFVYFLDANGGSTVTASGLCWSSSTTSPTIASHTGIISYSGENSYYSGSMSGLVPGTTYYLRAYATNAVGTAYSAAYTYTAPNYPTVSTDSVTVSQTMVTASGTLTSEGGATVSAFGFCWSSSNSLPSVGNCEGSTGYSGGTGSFSNTINSLSQNTVYYLRAYATNAVGTSYGSTLSFSLSTYASVSALTLTDPNSLVYTAPSMPSYSLGSEVSDMSLQISGSVGTTYTASATLVSPGMYDSYATCGFVWSKNSTYPTLTNYYDFAQCGILSSSSNFSYQISLYYSGDWYIRPYVQNSSGTTYGNGIHLTIY